MDNQGLIIKSKKKTKKKGIITGLKTRKIRTKKNNMIDLNINAIEHVQSMENNNLNNTIKYNEPFVKIMGQLSTIMMNQGEIFKSRAYQKAQETLQRYPSDITSIEQISNEPFIGSSIKNTLNEYINTGSVSIIELDKMNPINILGDVYGIGPKKAKELVSKGIVSIEELRIQKDEVLNELQIKALKYHEQILEKIPREEIDDFFIIIKEMFDTYSSSDSKFEIVGSYRRGADFSGDIDIIITGTTNNVYNKLIDELLNEHIIELILSRGKQKCLVIAKLPNGQISRRIDFLYTPTNEYAFATLYFTGSKFFNTAMRHRAQQLGYTLNEHGLYILTDKKKGDKLLQVFPDEHSIFSFLKMEYKDPNDRIDGRSIITIIEPIIDPNKIELDNIILTKSKKNKTLKSTVNKNMVDKGNNQIASENIENFKQNGIDVLEPLNEAQLSNIIEFANDAYFNNSQVLTDTEYDIIKDFIIAKFPLNSRMNAIGSKIEKNKIKLPYEMASMDKIKPDTSIVSTWSKKFTGSYVLSCKLDGVSGLYCTDGRIPKLYTRGDGKIGQDISYLINHLKLPDNKDIVIRGEFIISKHIFETNYKDKFANARNLVAGIINHKTITDDINNVEFVAYEVIKPILSPSEQMEFLKTINVKRVLYETLDNITNETLSDILVDWRSNYMYNIDGIIVTNDKIYPRISGNPEQSFAFKMVLSDQVAEAIVVDVLWNPSKDGYLKPRVRFLPIFLGGVKIEYATGFNGSFIKNNNIGVGAIIQIVRSGDVIPHIKSITEASNDPKMPSIPYKWNKSHVDIMLENIDDNDTVKEKNITDFFRGIEVDGLSNKTIIKIINAGYNTIPKIVKMTVKNFLQIDGFQSKLANKVVNGIKEQLVNASIVTLMDASNIFGRGIGGKKINVIMEDIPDLLVSDDDDELKINKISNVKGMSNETAKLFVLKIDVFLDFLKDIGLEYKLTQTTFETINNVNNPLYKKNIVITGQRCSQVLNLISSSGAILGSGVNKNTFILIAPSNDTSSQKMVDALKYNIPIMNSVDFLKIYNA